jgi:hypothetical protein
MGALVVFTAVLLIGKTAQQTNGFLAILASQSTTPNGIIAHNRADSIPLGAYSPDTKCFYL